MHEDLPDNRPQEKDKIRILTVAGNTSVHDLSVSIAKNIEEGSIVQVIGIGANAVNQMAKGAAKARSFLAPIGIDVAWKVFFTDREFGEGEKKEKVSALVFQSHLYR